MIKENTTVLVDRLNRDIAYAAAVGDTEYVALMKAAKAKVLDLAMPARHEEYTELFGK